MTDSTPRSDPATVGEPAIDIREIQPDEYPSPGWFDHRPPREWVGTVPDDWTVWAFSDPHGVRSGLVTALRDARLIDSAERWIAPAGTALVGCGDYIDRGRDSRGVVDLLQRLTHEAAAAGSRLWLARGNHEHLLDHLHAGGNEMLDHWLYYGGDAALDSYGCPVPTDGDPREMLRCLAAGAPDLLPWIADLSHAVRWRDVLFVHGGLVPYRTVEDFGRETDRHLWIRTAFYDTAWATGAFETYRRAGIERVVYGHTPLPDGARIQQDGRLLCLDTNACWIPTMPIDAIGQVTLVRLSGDVAFDEAHYVVVSTEHAPDRQGGR